jgi:choline oxidase
MKTELTFDYVVVGGGTSGAVLARRLAELSPARVCLLEAGPSDERDERALSLCRWPSLLGTELDYDYRSEPQIRGNSLIKHSRARMLGGCSSHNSAIAFRAPDVDLRSWESLGAEGWGPAATAPYYNRVFERVHIETPAPLNSCVVAFLEACEQAGLPRLDFQEPNFRRGAGWFRLNTQGDRRQSSSVAYLHPLTELPENLSVMVNTRALRVVTSSSRATGVLTAIGLINASREVVVCCGAFDTAKLLLLSGIGPADELLSLGIRVVADRPGVGRNLMDHPEGIAIWEAKREVPTETSQFWEAGVFECSFESDAAPEIMAHFGTVAYDDMTRAHGYETALNAFSMTPNVCRPRSRGTVRLRSSNPDDPPRIDMCYFTDVGNYDEGLLLEGFRLVRTLARQPALVSWILRELAPGEGVRSDAELSSYARSTSNTVFHPAGSCRIGGARDVYAVVDPELRVYGVDGLRIADASVFPSMIGVNPCITCMMIGERCADFIHRSS